MSTIFSTKVAGNCLWRFLVINNRSGAFFKRNPATPQISPQGASFMGYV
jgi:hypothetical protein